MPAIGRYSQLVGCFSAVTILAMAVVGCHSKPADADTLPANQKATLMEADRLINDGEDLKAQGMKLREAGKGGDDLIKQGEQKLTEGESLKAKGLMMKE